MNLSENGKRFIKSHEGFKDTYYDLGDGGLTVGFGNYMTYATARAKGIKKGDKITTAQANAMFDKAVKSFVDGTNAQIKQYGFNVNQNQFDALVSYAYNRGLGNSQGTNGLRQLLSHSKTVKAISSNILVYWGTNQTYKKGLLNRRTAEKRLFDTVVTTTAKKPTASKPLATNKVTKYKVTADMLNIRKSASATSKILGTLKKNDTVQVVSISNGWAKLKSNDTHVYVSASYIKKV